MLDWPSALVFFGSVIAIYGAFLASRKQADFETRMREKAEETLGQVSGGDSMCYVEPVGPADLVLSMRGRYPMYDVNIQITTDADKPSPQQLSQMTLTELLSRGVRFNFPIVYKDTATHLGPRPGAGAADQQLLHVLIRARNGTTAEELWTKERAESEQRPGGAPKFAFKVFRSDKLLLQRPDPVPTRADGTPDWEKIP